jgi:hypothetical protein
MKERRRETLFFSSLSGDQTTPLAALAGILAAEVSFIAD